MFYILTRWPLGDVVLIFKSVIYFSTYVMDQEHERLWNCSQVNAIKQLSNWFSLPLSPAWWSVFIFQWISARKRNSSALAMELHLSCPNPSICKWQLRCMFGIVPRNLLLISYIYSCFYTSPKVTLKWFLFWNICLYQEFVLSYSIDIVFFSFDDKWHCFR